MTRHQAVFFFPSDLLMYLRLLRNRYDDVALLAAPRPEPTRV